MKTYLKIILLLILISCSNHDTKETRVNSAAINNTSTINHPTQSNSPDTSQEKEMQDLIKKWTWNETIKRPKKSSISNAEFSSESLFKTWTWSDDSGNEPAFTFQKDSLKIHGEQKYIYTINHDSLRIFTHYERPGDGISRGMITKLTKDSLIIHWSTGDMNKYVSISK